MKEDNYVKGYLEQSSFGFIIASFIFTLSGVFVIIFCIFDLISEDLGLLIYVLLLGIVLIILGITFWKKSKTISKVVKKSFNRPA